MRVNSEHGVFEAIRAGVGLGHVGVSIAASASELRQLTPVFPALSLDIWVLIHSENRRSTRLRRFMQFLERVVPEQLGT